MGAGTNGGDVEYILRADDSNIEADLNKANAKVEKAAKKSADGSVRIEEQKTKALKSEADKAVKNSEKASEETAEAWRDAGRDARKAMEGIADEEVEVDVGADIAEAEKNIDSLEADDMEVGVDADTEKAESKIKNVSRDQSIDVDVNGDTSDAENAIRDLENVADDVGERISSSISGSGEGGSAFENIGKALSSSFSDAAGSAVPLVGKIGELTSGLSGAQVAAIGAGAALIGIGALGVGAANDINSAANSFIASTDIAAEQSKVLASGLEITIDNTERYKDIMEDIYKNNYGESFEDISAAMAEVHNNMRQLDDASLQNVTESAFALRDTFGYEVAESARAAQTLVEQFGISGEDAMNMIAAGAQNGLDYSGELLDSINEYSVQFEKVGLDADDMFSIFEAGAESGAFNLDKVGDAVKEMSIRVIDGSDTTKQGFELLGMNADEMAQKFAAGGDTAKEAFRQTIDALAAMEDPIEQNTAGVDLFGTMWEDLGPEAVTALSDIQEGAYETSDAMNKIKDVKYDDLGSQFEELKRNVEVAIIPIGEALIPLLSTLAESVLPVVTGVLGPLISQFVLLSEPMISLISSAVQPLITAFSELVTTAIQPLMPVIQALMSMFVSVMGGISGTVISVVNNITNIFRNLIDFVKNVFTGNWRGAWNNVKEIFSNAVSGLASIFKAPLNAIVDAWNGLASSIGSISIPEWVPGVGGNSYSLPRMSRLKIGLDYVPSDMFPAFLDEGEWVLTKEEADVLRSLGGIEGVLGIMGQSGIGSSSSTVVQGPEINIDYDKLGRTAASALVNAGVGFKCDQVVFARLIEDLIDYA